MSLSFPAYIAHRRAADDFTLYARASPDLPDAGSWPELRDWLVEHGADSATLMAALIVWRSFEKARLQF